MTEKNKHRFWSNSTSQPFTIEEDDLLLPDTKKRARKPIPTLLVTVEGIRKLLLNIKVSKAEGPELNLKHYAEDLCP